jgi:K+ transporter
MPDLSSYFESFLTSISYSLNSPAVLSLAALGVFGDIGTSPLYAF